MENLSIVSERLKPSGPDQHTVDEVKGDDDKYRVDEFFNKIVTQFNNPPISNIAVITVNHLAPTLPPFKKALDHCLEIAAIIPKGSHPDPLISQQIEHYSWRVSRDELNKKGIISDFIKAKIGNRKFVLIDIGAYFAPCLEELSAFGEQFLGIVEDTENGHQLYQRFIETSHKPIVSVARSKLKECEDYNVGKSIVHAVETILREDGHTILERQKTIGVIGFGKIGSSAAIHLRSKGIKRIIVYDINPIIQMKASALGFEITDSKDVITKKSDIIFCMTGRKSLTGDDFYNLKDNVFIASCTSADTELDLTLLEKEAKESVVHHVNVFTLINGKKINILHRGNAVNFVYKGVNGPFIYSVQAALIVSALKLAKGQYQPGVRIIEELPEEDQRTIATLWIDCFEKKRPKTIQRLPQQNGYFTGRNGYLTQLFTNFTQQSEYYQILCIQGLAGIGKTQLAKAYAYKYASKYNVICWFDMSGNIEYQFKQLANELKKQGFAISSDPETDGKDDIKIIYETLAYTKKWLFIFDNVEEGQDFSHFLPTNVQKTAGHIILTSQYKIIEEKKLICLKPFTPDESVKYLIEGFKDNRKVSEEECKALSGALDHYPLLVMNAIKYLNRNQKIPVKSYIEKVTSKSRSSVGRSKTLPVASGIEDNYNKMLGSSLKLIIDKMPEQRAKILRFIVLLHPENIPMTLVDNWTKTVKINEEDAQEELNALIDYGLLLTNDTFYQIHRSIRNELIQQLFLRDIDLNLELERSATFFIEVCHLIKTDHNTPEKEKQYGEFVIHFKTIANTLIDNQTQNFKLLLEICICLGKALRIVNNLKEACIYYEKAKTYLEINLASRIGEKNEYTVKIAKHLGNIYTILKKHKEAKTAYLSIVNYSSNEGFSVPDHLKATSLLGLARLYCQRKLPKEKIIKYAEEAHRLILSDHPIHSKRLIKAKEYLGKAYKLNKMYDKALEYFNSILLTLQQEPNNTTYIQAKIKFEKADTLMSKNDYSNALNLLKEILERYLELFGPEYEKIRITLVLISKCFNGLSQNKAGIEFFNNLKIKSKDSTTVKFLISLAQGYKNLGDIKQALSIYYDALELNRKFSSDENDLNSSIIYSSIGYLLHDKPDKFDEAIKVTEKALKSKQTLSGLDHVTVATEYRSLARIYFKNPSYAKYEQEIFKYLYEAYRIDALNPKGYKTNQRKTTLFQLLDACKKFGRDEERKRYSRELDEIKTLEETGKSSKKRNHESLTHNFSPNKDAKKEEQTPAPPQKPSAVQAANVVGMFKRSNEFAFSNRGRDTKVSNEERKTKVANLRRST